MTATVISIRTRRPLVSEADEPDTWASPVKPAPDPMLFPLTIVVVALWSAALVAVCWWGLRR